MQFGRLMQNKTPITVIRLFLSFLNLSQLLRRRNAASAYGPGDIVFKRSTTANQISTTYLNPQLRYNYFSIIETHESNTVSN